MKKLLWILITICLSFSLAACSNASKEKTITGTITDSSMNTFAVNVDGKEYIFEKGNASISSNQGLTNGAVIEITYTGTLKGTDTSDCNVVKIVQVGDAIQNSDQQITGIITDASMNNITIDDRTDEYTFSLNDDTAVAAANGIIVGDFVLVTFEGTLNGSDTSGANITKVEVLTDAIINTQEYEPNQFSGTIMEATMDTVTVMGDDNSEVTFLIDDQTSVNIQGGLSEGTHVIITYIGDLINYSAEDVTVLSIDAN